MNLVHLQNFVTARLDLSQAVTSGAERRSPERLLQAGTTIAAHDEMPYALAQRSTFSWKFELARALFNKFGEAFRHDPHGAPKADYI